MRPGEILPQPEHDDLVLVRGAGGLEIEDRSRPRATTVRVDFLGGRTARRGVGISRQTHPLARAVGRNQPLPTVLDGTAGLGRDAFVLACLGYRVTALERSPVLHALLADGIARLLAHPKGEQLVGDRLAVELGDCADRLRAAPRPDVVYLDPMFPHRRKSALVKKEMQLFQKLLGVAAPGSDEEESRQLVLAARRVATQRVVVKRPGRGAVLVDGVSYAVPGSSVRWDVYLADPNRSGAGFDSTPPGDDG
jgi:16S rRNA (guanine1516-N2)-methyltransferase